MKSYYKEKLNDAFLYATEKECFRKTDLIKQSDNVCVFGLGKYFDDAFIKQNVQKRFKVKYLCDNNSERLEQLKNNNLYKDIKGFIKPEQLKELKNVVVIFMLGDPRSAINQLKDIVGLENCIVYNDLVLDDIMGSDKDIDYYKSQKQKLFDVFDMLSDELSQKIFVNIFCLRVAPHLADLSYEELYTDNQYFSKDIVNLSQDENFVDCGAYIGDTLENFAELTNNNFENYYAFEMDCNNFKILQEKANEIINKGSKIECLPYGVWNEDTILKYGTMSSEDSYSIFNEKETKQVKAVKLDTILDGKKITFIKMDIEGAEMNALIGAKEIIQTQHPKMAICVYHRIEDLWQIPLFIKNLYPEYRIYLRHHAKYWVSETVCYAIP